MPLPIPLENPHGTPTPTAKTLGDLYDTVKSRLSPEEQKKLQDRAMEKFGGMNGVVAKMKEGITGNTRSELSELLHDMPGKDAILAKIDPLIPSSETLKRGADALKNGIPSIDATAAAALTASVDTLRDEATKTITGEGGKAVGNMVHAVSSGDIRGTVDGVKEVKSVWTSLSESFSNAFASLIELLEKMLGFKFGWFSDIVKKDKKEDGKPDAPKPPAEAAGAPARAQETAQVARESIEQKMTLAKETYWKQLQKGGWIRDPADQRARFDKLWEEKKSAIQRGVERVDSIILKGEKGNLMSDLFEPGTSEATGFLLRLVTDGVIPRDALFAAVGDLTKKSIKLGLKSAEAFITQTPKEVYTLIGEFSETDMSKLRPAEQSVLLASVHHNMGMMLTLAGKLSFAVGSLALMPLYWDQGSGVTKLKILKNGAVGDFDAATKNLDEMLKMLGDVDLKSPTREAFVQMREVIRETQLRSSITATYLELQKAGKTGVDIAGSLDEIVEGVANPKHALYGISKDSLTEFTKLTSDIRLGGGEQKLITYLEDGATRSSTMNTSQKLMQRFQSQVGYNPVQVRVADTIDQSKNVSKQLAEVVKNKNSLFKFWQQAKLAMKYEEFVACIDRGVLPIIAKDHTKAKGILERFVRAIPPGLDHFFSALTVTLTIAHVSASDDKLKTLAQDFAMMNPFYGGYVLFTEGMSVENRTFTNPAYVVSAGALWAIGGYQASKIITAGSTVARMSAIADFTLGPVATFGRGVAALSRGVSYGSLFAGNILKPGALRSFARPGLAGSAIMIAAITYYMYGVYSEENEQKFLAEKGIIKPDGTFDTEKLKTVFMSLPEDKRSGLLEKLLSNTLEPYGVKSTVQSGGSSVVMHTDRTTGSIAPISLDLFTSVADIVKELGVGDGKTFLSQSATEATKKYIASLPIDAAKKQEFYAKFGIIA